MNKMKSLTLFIETTGLILFTPLLLGGGGFYGVLLAVWMISDHGNPQDITPVLSIFAIPAGIIGLVIGLIVGCILARLNRKRFSRM